MPSRIRLSRTPDYHTLGTSLLLDATGPNLEHAVSDCLDSLGFIVFPGDPNKHDLLARSDKTKRVYSKSFGKGFDMTTAMTMCVLEITGTHGNVELAKLRQLNDWVEQKGPEIDVLENMAYDSWREGGRYEVIPRLKGVLIANWDLGKTIGKRSKIPFSEGLEEYAENHGFNLIVSPDLHYALEEISRGLQTKRRVRDTITDKTGFTVVSKKMNVFFS